MWCLDYPVENVGDFPRDVKLPGAHMTSISKAGTGGKCFTVRLSCWRMIAENSVVDPVQQALRLRAVFAFDGAIVQEELS